MGFYKNGICISVMNKKMEGIPAINTNPLINSFCKKMVKVKENICSKCYSYLMLLTTRKKCVPAYTNNTEKLSKRLLKEKDIPILNSLYFRFNAHGELHNKTHLLNLCKIAKGNPKTNFALWTKRANLVQNCLSEIPDNLILVYSTPKIDWKEPRIPKGFNRVFSTYTADYSIKNNVAINCMGKCIACLKCYKDKKTNKYINEVIKKQAHKYEEAKNG